MARKGRFMGIVEVELSVPQKWENRDIATVALDFSKVTGQAISKAEGQMAQDGKIGYVKALSNEYNVRLAAEISGIPYRAFEKMSGDDYELIGGVVAAWTSFRNPQEVYEQLLQNYDSDDVGASEPADFLSEG